jgi:micrococcal nuclease
VKRHWDYPGGVFAMFGGVHLYRYKAHVNRVIDGDTLIADVDLGFYIHLHELKFRLFGINTPEISGAEREWGLIVKDYVKGLLENKEVEIVSYKTDSFGRWLCDIYLGDLHINKHLFEEGMAKIYKG